MYLKFYKLKSWSESSPNGRRRFDQRFLDEPFLHCPGMPTRRIPSIVYHIFRRLYTKIFRQDPLPPRRSEMVFQRIYGIYTICSKKNS